MLTKVNTDIWEYHFVGSGLTYVYNHLENILVIISEVKQEVVSTKKMNFKSLETFQQACKEVFLDLIIECWGLN